MGRDRSDDASDADDHERVETGTDAMLDHVRQLIADFFVPDDNRCGSSFCRNEDVVVEPLASLLSTRDAKALSKNLKSKEDGGDLSARERLLETTLARVLMELAGEQDNLRLAANAGNALLKELGAAREELDVLHDELKAAHIERDQAVRDSQQLGDQSAAFETEMQRYTAVGNSTGEQNMPNRTCLQQTQQQRQSSLASRESFGRPDACKRCASREAGATQLDPCIDELRRRCLELELACEREQQQQRELAAKITQLQQRSKEQSLETVRAQQDLEFMTLQLVKQVEEVESVQAVRNTLHCTARRLKAENEGLQARLVARDELVEKLENDKVRAATQLQVAENRTMSAQAVTKRITKTLGQLQKQLEHALQQQQGGRDSKEASVDPCENEAEDIEQLLQEARREVEVLRLENRVLRCQHLSEASPNRSRRRSTRRKALCTDNPVTTAADVLALGSRELSRGEIASSFSESDIEPATSLHLQLVETIAPTTRALEPLSKDVTEQRIILSKRSWVDQPSTTIDDAATAVKEKFGSALVLRDGEHRTMLVNENQVECVLHQEMESVTTSSWVRASLSRLSHVNNHCNNPQVHLSWGDRKKKAIHLSAIGYTERPRIRELPIEVMGREAIELPPTSPLYLGLSFIACATAATAANFLVRR